MALKFDIGSLERLVDLAGDIQIRARRLHDSGRMIVPVVDRRGAWCICGSCDHRRRVHVRGIFHALGVANHVYRFAVRVGDQCVKCLLASLAQKGEHVRRVAR